MASVSLFVSFVLSHLVLLHSAEEEGKRENPYCRSFQCGKLGDISFPFTEIPPSFPPPFCSSLQVECDETHPMIHLPLGDPWSERRYEVINISYTTTTQRIRLRDHSLLEYLETGKCENLDHFAFPSSPIISFKLTTPNRTLFKCNHPLDITFPGFKNIPCREHNIYYYSPSNEASQKFSPECPTIQLPGNEISQEDEPNLIAEFDLELHLPLQGLNITAEFDLEVHILDVCSSCYIRGGLCELDNRGKFIVPLQRKAGHTVHIAGLMRLDIEESSVDSIYVTVWASPYLLLHVGKTENAQIMQEKHFGLQLQPPIGEKRVEELGKWVRREFRVSGNSWDSSSVDIAASGLGLFAVGVKGEAVFGVWTYKGVDVVLRNSLIPYRSHTFEVAGFTVSKIVSKADQALNKRRQNEKKRKQSDPKVSVPAESPILTVGADSNSC
nr:gtp-binding protein brassinazole insensitive pale green 2, chloroplastic [Quercus suber]